MRDVEIFGGGALRQKVRLGIREKAEKASAAS